MMNREVGDKACPIWLLGDSNPANWQNLLVTPLDPRHPARHNIWTPVLEVMQDRVYRKKRLRIDTSAIYIRNAVGDPAGRPKGSQLTWPPELELEFTKYRELLNTYCPRLVLCFGAFAFEFLRRARQESQWRPYRHWGARTLGDAFRISIDKFGPVGINVLPLLHISISGGKFVQSHNYFAGHDGANYFEYVGTTIADKLLQYQVDLPIWIH